MNGKQSYRKFSVFSWLGIAPFLFFALSACGQTVQLPDTAFRNFLKKAYPNVIDANGHLITAEAAKVGGIVNGSYRNITNLEGIQYFTNAKALSFVGNALVALPSLSSISNLDAINIMYNNLVVLPSLSSLKRLKVLNAHGNKLSSLPDLSLNDSLVELNLNTNLLDSLPRLGNLVRLQRLHVHNNRLKRLMGIENLVSLVEFTCNSNQLGNFPPLTKWKNIRNVDASGNQLTAAPYFGANTTLQTMSLHQNAISSLPDYTLCTGLRKVTLYQNNLTFKELLVLTRIPRYDTVFAISPQKMLKVGKQWTWTEGSSAVFSTGVDNGVEGVGYNWYKNGKLDTTVASDNWAIPFVYPTDSGHYTSQLTHPAFANFALETDVFTVSVLSCLDLSAVSTAATEINCMKTGTLEVGLPTTLSSVFYQLKSPSSGKVYSSVNGRFVGLTEPIYTLSFQTATGCSKTYPKEIRIPLQKCKDYLITPDNDGNADTFYFEASGKVEIYDKRGNMIRRLSIPSEWDCFSDKGKVPSGYYIASINDGESQIGLSVVY